MVRFNKNPIVKEDGPLCGGLYKEYHGYIVPWSVIDPDAKLDYFTWSKEENDWIVLGDQYNKEFKNWQGPIHNGQFRPQILKDKRIIERICSKYSISIKFNGIPIKGKPKNPIKYYKDKCRVYMIVNDILSILYPRNKEKRWDIFLH